MPLKNPVNYTVIFTRAQIQLIRLIGILKLLKKPLDKLSDNNNLMKKSEIFKSLIQSQRQEFEKDTQVIIEEIIKSGNLHFDKSHEINVNLRLGDVIFLNVTLEFIATGEGVIHGIVSDIKKFNNLDEYLDSINASKNKDSSWTKLK